LIVSLRLKQLFSIWVFSHRVKISINSLEKSQLNLNGINVNLIEFELN
jgi:hypothetical protein